MKHLFTLLMASILCTGLHAQNSTLTLYFTSTISGSTPVTISAVAPGSTDYTVIDTVVAEFGENTVSYTFPDTTTSVMLSISWLCDGVQSPAIPFFVGNNTPGEPFDEEIIVEIGCQDTECDWYLDVNPPNDLTSPTTFEVITEGSPAIYEWYVDGELVPPNTSTGGLLWQAPYETICAVMYSLGDCPDPGTQCYDNPGNGGGGGGMDCLDGIDVGALITYLTTMCADQTNLDFWMYCGLMESLTDAMNGDEDACEDLWAWLDAGGWEGETGCDINFEVMQAWEANGELIPNEVWVWIYDYDSEYTYTYDFGDESPVTTEPNPSHTYSGDGPYTFCITVSSEADSCSATYCETLSVDSLGMLEGFMSGFTVNVMGAGEVVNSVETPEWTDTFEVYPNPVRSRGQLMLRGIDGFRHFHSNQGNVRYKAELSTLTGERLILDTSGDVQNGRLRIPLGDIAPGLYLLLLENQGVGATRKVVIR